MKNLLVGTFLLLLSACSSLAPESSKNLDRQPTSVNSSRDKFCAVESKLPSGMVLCEQFYQSRPYVHLPKPSTDGDQIHLIGSVNGKAQGTIYNDDQSFRLETSEGDRLMEVDDYKALLGNREQFTLFEVSGRVSRDKSAIVISKFKPAVLLSPCAIDGILAGEWTAVVPKRIAGADSGVGKFTATLNVPIHITIKRMEKFKGIIDTYNSDVPEDKFIPIDEGKTAKLIGVLDNLNENFVSSTGITYPALNALGDENPFKGAKDNSIALERFSGMHMFADYHFVMEFPEGSLSIGTAGMTIGGTSIIQPESFISKKAEDGVTSMMPHTTPSGFEISQLRLEKPGVYSISCPNQ